jgi:group II intron reverse transcriptase/maturase
MTTAKPYVIARDEVWQAWQQVKANQGVAGIDGQTIAAFEERLQDNLYKLWNRMSSGSYFPPPVRTVAIPKGDGGVRVLGVPTVADRVAQTVVRQRLEPLVEPHFHPDSYGYRPRRSALQAVGVCQRRSWQQDWVIDLDIAAFFDTLDHELLLKAVRKHTEERWVLLYIERWLVAPVQAEDGTQEERRQGSPQGSAISPLLANIYLHYAFDAWMHQRYPSVRFERYCDDIVVHATDRQQAELILAAIAERLAACKLAVNREKTRIVHCQDDRRRGGGGDSPTRFDFLGYTFRARSCKDRRTGKSFLGFNPAMSEAAKKRIGQVIRRWRLHCRSDLNLTDLAQRINPVVRGWIAYYGRYFPSVVTPILKRINAYLMRWAQRTYKRLHRHPRRAWRFLATVATREPELFAHWAYGVRPWAG